MEVGVVGLLDLEEGIEGSLPSRSACRGSWMLPSVASIGLRKSTMMFTRSEEVEVTADDDEVGCG